MSRIKLPHDETDPIKIYSMPDPDALRERYATAREKTFPGFGEGGQTVLLTYEEACGLIALAEGYLDLTTYILGQECCVSKLRDIWRARRERQS